MLLGFSLAAAMPETGLKPVFFENFENPDNGPYKRFVEDIERFGWTEILPDIGVNGGHGLRVQYKGTKGGSSQSIIDFVLPSSGLEMTLNFDVMFEEGFQFVLGGKLNGLGPLHKVTGGREMKPDGWSARIMWRNEGVVENYLYHQNKSGQYGERGTRTNPYKFDTGQYHAVSIHVRVNEDPDEATGFSRVYIDGVLVDASENMQFRAVATPESEICQFLFSTFHGGHTPKYAPKDKDGNYISVYARYDNIVVSQGEHIRKEPGA